MKKMLSCLALLALALLIGMAACAEPFVLPASLVRVDAYAFYGDTAMVEVVIPDGAKEIGEKAFAESGLQRIVIPDSVKAIADDAFDGVKGLTIVSSSSAYARQFASGHEGISWENANAAAPVTPDSPLTRDNIIALLDEIDPDGAFILRNSDGDIGVWFGSAKTIANGIGSLETAVHEQCHRYCGTPDGMRYNGVQGKYMPASEWIYIGNGRHIEVTMTDVFPSSELVDTIPESLRTFRFNTYMNGSPYTASIQFGPYGMLDEFTAYCWGLHNDISQKGFREENDLVSRYYSNGFVAYAEFRYYILHYMLYAKAHYPDVYSGILNNASFRKAFATIDNKFSGFAEKQKNDYYIGEWNALMGEMEKKDYVNMAKLLKS